MNRFAAGQRDVEIIATGDLKVCAGALYIPLGFHRVKLGAYVVRFVDLHNLIEGSNGRRLDARVGTIKIKSTRDLQPL